ncbi:radical SAM protein [Mycoplasmatota bacterium]|nr:radical SAM protein [Mycoplasmatota bacterium]
MKVNYIDAKKIVYPVKHSEGWFGVSYNMNIYRGCHHGCIYCDSRSDVYQIKNFDEVKTKKNVKQKLESELITKKKTGIIGMGAMSDPYNKFESELGLTRESLKLIDKYGFGVNIVTKSDLIVRDLDILKRIQKHSSVIVCMTITTYDDELAKIIEPGAPTTTARFKALEELVKCDIYSGITLMPILPKINDNTENIEKIIKKAGEIGAEFISPFYGLTLRKGQREYFYDKLNRYFIGATDFYQKQFGSDYSCHSTNNKQLYELTEKLCNKFSIKYKMKDIIDKSRDYVIEGQISLF